MCRLHSRPVEKAFLVCVDSYNGPNLVLKYDKEKKRLVNIAVDNQSSPFYALRDRQGNAIGVTACDIDGDGREEIYVLNTNNAFSGTIHSFTHAYTVSNMCTHSHVRTSSIVHTKQKNQYANIELISSES